MNSIFAHGRCKDKRSRHEALLGGGGALFGGI